MTQNGSLASFLEQYRSQFNGQDFDTAVTALIQEEELVPALRK